MTRSNRPESTAVWTQEQYEKDELDTFGGDEDDKWNYTNWHEE